MFPIFELENYYAKGARLMNSNFGLRIKNSKNEKIEKLKIKTSKITLLKINLCLS
jgi:hypothetical protein